MIKGIIFDYDGVISDSYAAVLKVNEILLRKLNKESFLSHKKYEQMSTNWKSQCTDLGLTEEELKKIPDFFLEEMTKLSDEIKLFNGIDEVISTLHKKYKLGIVSNGDRRRIELSLEKHGLLDYFGCIVDLSAEKHKPDPHQVLVCAESLGLKTAEICLVGDTLDDIQAGRNAKVGTIIAVTYGYQKKDMLKGADIYVASPQELLKVLEEL